MDWQERSRRLAGPEKIIKLEKSHVLLFGLGGVGSFTAEALARSGVGKLSLVEYDQIIDSNRNRQLPALVGTVGQNKIDVCAARLKEINPELELVLYPFKMTAENLPAILAAGRPDFIADAIDDLAAKVRLIITAKDEGIPIISSMGAGYRLDPSQLAIGDISQTHTCPLARRLRRSLKEEGLAEGLPVVWSKENPLPDHDRLQDGAQGSGQAGAAEAALEMAGEVPETAEAPKGRKGPASMIFVPASAGLLMASYIIRNL